MKTSKKNHKRTNPVAVAMTRRYGTTTTTMRDRREERRGAKNRQREYLKDCD